MVLGWNGTKLCCADSDGDGQTNGHELGDDCCVWTQGAAPAFSANISHPGLNTSTTPRAAAPCLAVVCPGHGH